MAPAPVEVVECGTSVDDGSRHSRADHQIESASDASAGQDHRHRSSVAYDAATEIASVNDASHVSVSGDNETLWCDVRCGDDNDHLELFARGCHWARQSGGKGVGELPQILVSSTTTWRKKMATATFVDVIVSKSAFCQHLSAKCIFARLLQFFPNCRRGGKGSQQCQANTRTLS